MTHSLDDRTEVSAVMVVAAEPPDRIVRAVDSLARQRHSAVREIVVAATREDAAGVASALAGCEIDVRIVENGGGRRAPGLNVALREARCEIVCRLDARSVLPPDYVQRCARRLALDSCVGVVGGVQSAVAGGPGIEARGIGRALANPWALGGAAYRKGRSGPADTVYLGVFWRDQLVRMGGWDERLDANEDFDLCQRYRAAGLLAWVEKGLAVRYEARADYRSLAAQYRAFGSSKVLYWRTTSSWPAPRQVAAILGPGAAALSAVVLLARRRRWLLGTAVIAVVALGALDEVGVGEPAGLSERAGAGVAYLILWASWVTGIVEGLARLLGT